VTVLLVALGAAVGAPVRYVAGHLLDERWPWGTVLVNWAGSFLLGLLVARGVSEGPLALFGTGFCGGLTTYSAFAVHVHDRGPRLGSAVALVTLVPAIALCALGFRLGTG
jgi:CrcB protein